MNHNWAYYGQGEVAKVNRGAAQSLFWLTTFWRTSQINRFFIDWNINE
jgi:hypothetical protein